MKKKYYLIHTNEKGFSSVTVMEKPALEKFLKELVDDEDADDIVGQFLTPVGRGRLDLAYAGNTYLLIEGEAIRPTIAETITKLII
jgi:hypothetical protein